MDGKNQTSPALGWRGCGRARVSPLCSLRGRRISESLCTPDSQIRALVEELITKDSIDKGSWPEVLALAFAASTAERSKA